MFEEYKKDRSRTRSATLIKNLRQFAGKYDPEIEQKLPPLTCHKAYPRITRVKVLLTLARLMNLMFPGNEKNWEIKATPSADITPGGGHGEAAGDRTAGRCRSRHAGDPGQAAQRRPQAHASRMQGPPKPKITAATVRAAVQEIAEERAREMEIEIEDQLAEMGGDHNPDFIALVRSVSAIRHHVRPRLPARAVRAADDDNHVGRQTARCLACASRPPIRPILRLRLGLGHLPPT
jgi:hypothetical protein